MDFVGVFGLLLMIVTVMVAIAGKFTIENPDCQEEINAVKNNKKSLLITSIAGGICLLSWLIYTIINN